MKFISFLNNRIYPQYGQCFRVPFHLIYRGCSHAQSWYSLLICALRTLPIRSLSGKIFSPISSSVSGKNFDANHPRYHCCVEICRDVSGRPLIHWFPCSPWGPDARRVWPTGDAPSGGWRGMGAPLICACGPMFKNTAILFFGCIKAVGVHPITYFFSS